jgi:hypothetical protein
MKIASFNINNINRRLSNLLGWLREAEPDIVCLQELKVADSEFPTEAIRRLAIMRHGAARGAGTAWRSLRDRRLPTNRWRTLYGIACAKSWGVLLALVCLNGHGFIRKPGLRESAISKVRRWIKMEGVRRSYSCLGTNVISNSAAALTALAEYSSGT